MVDIEVWKDIKGYEGLYQISNLGNVKSLSRKVPNCNQTGFTGSFKIIKEKILKPKKDRKGYFYVDLHKNGKAKATKIHRIVGEMFLNNPNNLPQINHLNRKEKR